MKPPAPESMWQAIRELGAERIATACQGHLGSALMAHLAEHRIGIESRLTPTSDHHGGESGRSPDPPVPAAGVLACLNTDDPAVEGIDPAPMNTIDGGPGWHDGERDPHRPAAETA